TTTVLDASYDALGTGELRANATAARDQSFAAAAAFRRIAGGFEADLHQLGFTARGSRWALGSTASLRFDERGLDVAQLQLNQAGAQGRIGVDGRLPWAAPAGSPDSTGAAAAPVPADFRVNLRDVRIADFLAAAGPEPATDGLLAGQIQVGGVARAPEMDARFTLAGFRYHDVRLDSISADLSYRDQALVALVRAMDGGRSIFAGSGTIPVDLSLTDVEQRRL